MSVQKDVKKGWKFMSEVMGNDAITQMSDDYIERVEEEIRNLQVSVNNEPHQNLDFLKSQGFDFEEWEAGTFNIDAAASGSTDHANVLHSTAPDSVDIQLDSGLQYSLKSYSTPEKSASAQARINPDTGRASYYGQERLVPADQLSAAKSEAHRQALRNQNRPDVAKAYKETEQRLTESIENGEGVSSIPIGREDLNSIAKKSKSQEFDPKDYGVTLENSIKPEYILKESVKAGGISAGVTVAFQLAPEIYKAIDCLEKNGELDMDQVKAIGWKGISSGAEGFLRGAISAALLIKCREGALGANFLRIEPNVLGTMVTIVMQTAKDSILVAENKISPKQMGSNFADMVVISGGYLFGSHIGKTIDQALGIKYPIFGILVGSLLGTSLSALYSIGKEKWISFCKDTGFTCFGLVEQDYEVPSSIMCELGIEKIPIKHVKIKRVHVSRANIKKAPVKLPKYETLDFTILRDGVVGVEKVEICQ